MDRWEHTVERRIHAFVLAHHWMATLSGALTHLGDPIVVTVATLALAVALWVAGRQRAAVYVLAVRVVALVVDTGLKHAVGRPRPVLAHPLATARGFSFPSGHALGSAALWASIAVILAVRPLAKVAVAAVVPVVVALTRVVLGVHYPTDVLAGLLLGWGVAVAMAAVLRPGAGISPRIAADRRVNDR